MAPVIWTKAYRFSAGHRLFHPARGDDWNLSVFGKCSYRGGHGHNYELRVGIRGEPDPESGLVVRESAVDAIVEGEVFRRFDHRNLNDEVSGDFGPAPTTEVLALEIWKALAPRIPPPARLFRVWISETSKNSFECFGPSRQRSRA